MKWLGPDSFFSAIAAQQEQLEMKDLLHQWNEELIFPPLRDKD